jgi:hypothetical protein
MAIRVYAKGEAVSLKCARPASWGISVPRIDATASRNSRIIAVRAEVKNETTCEKIDAVSVDV